MYKRHPVRLLVLFICVFFVIVFRNWINYGVLSSGDWVFYYPQTMREFDFLSAWDIRHNGLGQSHIPILWIDLYFHLAAKAAVILGLSWELFERLFFFFPFLFVGYFSLRKLYAYIFPNSGHERHLAPLLYLTNTYVLLVVGGGQVGVGLAYALLPYALYLLLRLSEKIRDGTVQPGFLARVILISGLLFVFDIRVGFLTFFVYSLYVLLIDRQTLLQKVKEYVRVYAFIGIGVFLLHAFWIFPILLYNVSPVGSVSEAYTSAGMLEFLSFSDLSHALSWLHPNWPENIFGKTYFLRPEFLVFPILAFTGLLFTRSIRYVFFFLIALIGAILARGTNGELGFLYTAAFEHIPGFVLFRDPTKFYILISLSYALLLPRAIRLITEYTKKRLPFPTVPEGPGFQSGDKWHFWAFCTKFRLGKSKEAADVRPRRLTYTPAVITGAFLLFWTFAIREAVTGSLGGTLARHEIPQSYSDMQKFLAQDVTFGRVLWFPTRHRYSYYSDTHPAVNALEFTQSASSAGALRQLAKPMAPLELDRASIAYVAVVEDTDNEFFISDHLYDPGQYEEAVNTLTALGYLTEVARFGNIVVFKTPEHKPLFYSFDREGGTVPIGYEKDSQTGFRLSVPASTYHGDIRFTQRYDPGWRLLVGSEQVAPEKTKFGHMAFPVPKKDQITSVEYIPQRGVRYGLVIAGITAAVLIVVSKYRYV